MTLIPKATNMFNIIPIKIPMTFITEIEKSTLNFIAKGIFSKKSNPGGITVTNMKLYYRAIAIKTAWYWQLPPHPTCKDQ
jgi:hypothetical protein